MHCLFLCDDGDVEKIAPICEEFGAGIEIQGFYDPSLLSRDPNAISRHLALLNPTMQKSLHGCYGDLCPGSFDPMVREVAMNRFDLSYRIGKELQVGHIVFHHGYVPHTSKTANVIRRTTEFWHSFLEGKDDSIQFYIENHFDNDYRLLSDVIDSIGKPNVKVNLDIGHAHFASKFAITEWIEKLGARIGYVHLHDNHGEEDEHLGLGLGAIPMKEVCDALNRYAVDAIWAIETDENGIRESVDWLEENLFL